MSLFSKAKDVLENASFPSARQYVAIGLMGASLSAPAQGRVIERLFPGPAQDSTSFVGRSNGGGYLVLVTSDQSISPSAKPEGSIVIMNTETKQIFELGVSGIIGNPVCSSNGWVAYIKEHDGTSDVYVRNINNPSVEIKVSVSKTGGQVDGRSGDITGGNGFLNKISIGVKPDGTIVVCYASTGRNNVEGLANVAEALSRVYATSIAPEGSLLSTECVSGLDTTVNSGEPTCSADGTRIAYSKSNTSLNGESIVVVELGGSQSVIGENAGVLENRRNATLSDDGTKLGYLSTASYGSFQLVMHDLSNGIANPGTGVLISKGADGNPIPEGLNYGLPLLSADENGRFWSVGFNTGGIWRIDSQNGNDTLTRLDTAPFGYNNVVREGALATCLSKDGQGAYFSALYENTGNPNLQIYYVSPDAANPYDADNDGLITTNDAIEALKIAGGSKAADPATTGTITIETAIGALKNPGNL